MINKWIIINIITVRNNKLYHPTMIAELNERVLKYVITPTNYNIENLNIY